jgi:hypothetical protein
MHTLRKICIDAASGPQNDCDPIASSITHIALCIYFWFSSLLASFPDDYKDDVHYDELTAFLSHKNIRRMLIEKGLQELKQVILAIYATSHRALQPQLLIKLLPCMMPHIIDTVACANVIREYMKEKEEVLYKYYELGLIMVDLDKLYIQAELPITPRSYTLRTLCIKLFNINDDDLIISKLSAFLIPRQQMLQTGPRLIRVSPNMLRSALLIQYLLYCAIPLPDRNGPPCPKVVMSKRLHIKKIMEGIHQRIQNSTLDDGIKDIYLDFFPARPGSLIPLA